jgi:hypothetical protein
MTRDKYRSLKGELKRLAANRKQLKADFRSWQRDNRGRSSYHFWDNRSIDDGYWNFRAGHIFMSLVRGRTRIQIENNFDSQALSRDIENRIMVLCEQYGFETDRDEQFRIIEVIPDESAVRTEEVGV